MQLHHLRLASRSLCALGGSWKPSPPPRLQRTVKVPINSLSGATKVGSPTSAREPSQANTAGKPSAPPHPPAALQHNGLLVQLQSVWALGLAWLLACGAQRLASPVSLESSIREAAERLLPPPGAPMARGAVAACVSAALLVLCCSTGTEARRWWWGDSSQSSWGCALCPGRVKEAIAEGDCDQKVGTQCNKVTRSSICLPGPVSELVCIAKRRSSPQNWSPPSNSWGQSWNPAPQSWKCANPSRPHALLRAVLQQNLRGPSWASLRA